MVSGTVEQRGRRAQEGSSPRGVHHSFIEKDLVCRLYVACQSAMGQKKVRNWG
jgi:hypothetical protein